MRDDNEQSHPSSSTTGSSSPGSESSQSQGSGSSAQQSSANAATGPSNYGGASSPAASQSPSANAATGPSNYGDSSVEVGTSLNANAADPVGPSANAATGAENYGGDYGSAGVAMDQGAAQEIAGHIANSDITRAGYQIADHLSRATGVHVSVDDGMSIAKLGSKITTGETAGTGAATPAGMAGVLNTFLNNIASDVKRTGRVNMSRITGLYDAAGTTRRTAAYQTPSYSSAGPGVPGYDTSLGILGSMFGIGDAPPGLPPGIETSTNYFNPQAATPSWAQSPGFQATQQALGPHTFGNPDVGKSPQDIADARSAVWGFGGAPPGGGIMDAGYQQPVAAQMTEGVIPGAQTMTPAPGMPGQPVAPGTVAQQAAPASTQQAVQALQQMLGIGAPNPLPGIQPSRMAPTNVSTSAAPAGQTLVGTVNPDMTMGQKWVGGSPVAPVDTAGTAAPVAPSSIAPVGPASLSPVDTGSSVPASLAPDAMQPAQPTQERVSPPEMYAGSPMAPIDSQAIAQLSKLFSDSRQPPGSVNIPAAAGVGVSPGYGVDNVRPTPQMEVNAAPSNPGFIDQPGPHRTLSYNDLLHLADTTRPSTGNGQMASSRDFGSKGFVRDPATGEMKPKQVMSQADLDALLELLFGPGSGRRHAHA